jgi:hypothetical protein
MRAGAAAKADHWSSQEDAAAKHTAHAPPRLIVFDEQAAASSKEPGAGSRLWQAGLKCLFDYASRRQISVDRLTVIHERAGGLDGEPCESSRECRRVSPALLRLPNASATGDAFGERTLPSAGMLTTAPRSPPDSRALYAK